MVQGLIKTRNSLYRFMADSSRLYLVRLMCITLFRFVTMFYGTDNIPCSILKYSSHSDCVLKYECGEYSRILHGTLSIIQKIVMNLNNVTWGSRIHVHVPFFASTRLLVLCHSSRLFLYVNDTLLGNMSIPRRVL